MTDWKCEERCPECGGQIIVTDQDMKTAEIDRVLTQRCESCPYTKDHMVRQMRELNMEGAPPCTCDCEGKPMGRCTEGNPEFRFLHCRGCCQQKEKWVAE